MRRYAALQGGASCVTLRERRCSTVRAIVSLPNLDFQPPPAALAQLIAGNFGFAVPELEAVLKSWTESVAGTSQCGEVLKSWTESVAGTSECGEGDAAAEQEMLQYQ